MSINKAREVIPPRVKNVGRNPAQLSFDGTPKTFGLKLIGDHGYVWNVSRIQKFWWYHDFLGLNRS